MFHWINVHFFYYVQVSEELIRVAILWHELWHEGLEEASRLYFGERNVTGMFATLEPLHAMLERGPQTLKETSFHQVNIWRQMVGIISFINWFLIMISGIWAWITRSPRLVSTLQDFVERSGSKSSLGFVLSCFPTYFTTIASTYKLGTSICFTKITSMPVSCIYIYTLCDVCIILFSPFF